MGSTITKFVLSIMIGLTVLLGFLALTGDIMNNYDVQNDTGYVGELKTMTDDLYINVSKEINPTASTVQKVDTITFIGTIGGVIMDAIMLPFRLSKFAFTFVSGSLAMIGLPPIISNLITLVLTLIIMLGVLKIILGRNQL